MVTLLSPIAFAHAEDNYAVKCYSVDGRQFRPVSPPHRYPGGPDRNAFYALLRSLGITREQYEQWGEKCDPIMGLNDPRPYTPLSFPKKI